MDLRYTPEEEQFRKEVRAFFRTAIPADIQSKTVLGQRLSREDLVRWTHILNQKGWATPNWPVEWGGTGWSPICQYIFHEELAMVPVPEALVFNTNMIGPLLIAFGTNEQKRHFLPRIATLEYWFCQGFSEPDAGSDLASLRTRAVRDGEDYVISGQKIWTTLAHHADWCFLLARTDPQAKKQRGISMFLMDMTSPGVMVKPIVTIDGCHELNETFLDDVRIPTANLIGEENKGWDYAKYLLGHERSAQSRVGLSKMRLRRAKQLAAGVRSGGRTLAEDPHFRERVAGIEVELKALELLTQRVIAQGPANTDGASDPKASILKLKGVALQQEATEILMEVAGYEAMEYDGSFLRGESEPAGGEDWALTIAPNHYYARHVSIAAGSNEVQRNIIARSVLGL
ncbi:MAG: acyl-CoA dehydrogenase family protein [Novosphingobium sp.]